MTVPSKRSLLVLLVAVGLSVSLTGCFGGGGGDETTDTTAAASTATAAPIPIGTAVDRLITTKVAATQDTPEAYVSAVGQAKPVAILFYVPGNADDAKVIETFKTIQSDFPDYIFLAYDYRNPSDYGDLSLLLQVNYPPEIVLIDKNGAIQNIWNGYVDEGTLKQCLINLGQG